MACVVMFMNGFMVFWGFMLVMFLILGVVLLYNNQFLTKFMGMDLKTYLLYSCLYFLLFLFIYVYFGWNSVLGVVMIGSIWLGESIIFSFDFLSLMFLGSAMIVSISIFEFGLMYMEGESSDMNFLLLLNLFLFFMFCLVFSGDVITLFIGWEGVGILSYILISWWFGRGDAQGGSMQAVIYNRVGDFGMVMIVLMLFLFVDGLSIGWMGGMTGLLYLFILLCIIAKSSQLFFHPWLPNAMEGPTPVSSLLHSSTMVVAGVYLVLRMNHLIGFQGEVLLIGIFTSLFGGLCASFQSDFKKVVAFSTTSQLGFMLVTLGLGQNLLCLAYMVFHAFFKANLFMVSGVLIHGSGNIQDYRSMRLTFMNNSSTKMMFMISSLAMMGFPFLSGFWAKDVILEYLLSGGVGVFLLVVGVIGALLTSVYSVRLYYGIFGSGVLKGNKVIGMEGLLTMSYLWRMMLGVVSMGVLFLLIMPYEPVYIGGFLKLVPLFLILLGGMTGFYLLFKSNKGLFYLFYLYFYNPLMHKYLSSSVGKISEYLISFDFVMLEWVGPLGVKKVFLKMIVFMFILIIGVGLGMWM
uniref:NADH:ubiquinone reductase (H(+)-translocating) n=1 Tax=Microcosmus sulcatus TaxID=341086 RepID=D2YVG4_9ASCI|nr:NADH dehydrogenase subunit 5 [Microcosmus sulcatus]CAL23087.2 NADH dehydrogenase subunit 5 [Microcosmus sulcatus]